MLRLLSFIFFFIYSIHPCFSKCPRHKIIVFFHLPSSLGKSRALILASWGLALLFQLTYKQTSLWQCMMSSLINICCDRSLLFLALLCTSTSLLLQIWFYFSFLKDLFNNEQKCAFFDNKSNSTHMSESMDGIGIHIIMYNVKVIH